MGKGEYDGVFDCGRKIFKAYGIKGAYQGFSAVLLRNVPCFGAYFFCFEVGSRLYGARLLMSTSKNVGWSHVGLFRRWFPSVRCTSVYENFQRTSGGVILGCLDVDSRLCGALLLM